MSGLDAIFDEADVGLLACDAEGRVTFANATIREIIGRGDALGLSAMELLGLPGSLDRILAGRPRVQLLVTARGAAGEPHELSISITRSSERAPGVGFCLVVRDRTEDAIRDAERHRFDRLVALGTMVAGFAHEVRNPVAALRSIAEALAEEHEAARLRLPHVARMLEVLERIEDLVATSLQLGRPAAPRRAAHRPWSIVSQALTSVGPRLRSMGQQPRIDLEDDLADVFCDDRQSAQALVVLIDNALDAAASASKVIVRARSERAAEGALGAGGWIRLEVADEGPGIPNEDLERVFDPFFTTKPRGTGLGLSIAQQLVSENGGRIEVRSRPGGTTFAIVLPTTR